jgi:hypothetical protein
MSQNFVANRSPDLPKKTLLALPNLTKARLSRKIKQILKKNYK